MRKRLLRLIPITFEDEETYQIGVGMQSAHDQRTNKDIKASRKDYRVRPVSISKSWLLKEPCQEPTNFRE